MVTSKNVQADFSVPISFRAYIPAGSEVATKARSFRCFVAVVAVVGCLLACSPSVPAAWLAVCGAVNHGIVLLEHYAISVPGIVVVLCWAILVSWYILWCRGTMI